MQDRHLTPEQMLERRSKAFIADSGKSPGLVNYVFDDYCEGFSHCHELQPALSEKNLKETIAGVFGRAGVKTGLFSTCRSLLYLLHKYGLLGQYAQDPQDRYSLATALLVYAGKATAMDDTGMRVINATCLALFGKPLGLDDKLVETFAPVIAEHLFGTVWASLFEPELRTVSTCIDVCYNQRPAMLGTDTFTPADRPVDSDCIRLPEL